MAPAPRAELSRDVIERAQRGERDAQGQVLRRYAGVFHQLVRRIASDRDPDALTQSLLERVLVVLPRFAIGGPASLTTWLFTVAHHFLIDELRRRPLAVVPLEHAEQVVDPAADPQREAWRRQVRDALEVAITRLPVEQRRTFVFVHLHEHSLEACAEAEGVPVGTIKSRLFRARAALAKDLGPLLAEVRHE